MNDSLSHDSESMEPSSTEAGKGKLKPPPINQYNHLPPQPPPGLPRVVEADQDAEHIKILSICYYVNAGLTALLACIPIIYVFMGIVMMSAGPSPGAPDPKVIQMMGGIFVGMAAAGILIGWVFAFLNYLVGRRMVRRQSRILCLIVAGINCLNMPLGTVLGVFTFIVLGRPQVVQSFEENKPIQ